MSGFSDTIWYGAYHFSLCHHLEELRAVVHYKPAGDKSYTGDIAELELRQDLPSASARESGSGIAENGRAPAEKR
jgi:hypothetical protein